MREVPASTWRKNQTETSSLLRQGSFHPCLHASITASQAHPPRLPSSSPCLKISYCFLLYFFAGMIGGSSSSSSDKSSSSSKEASSLCTGTHKYLLPSWPQDSPRAEQPKEHWSSFNSSLWAISCIPAGGRSQRGIETVSHGKRGQHRSSRPLFPCKTLQQGRNPQTWPLMKQRKRGTEHTCWAAPSASPRCYLAGICTAGSPSMPLTAPKPFPTHKSIPI